MQREIAALTDRMARALGDRLVSLILYGSAAGGDHDGRFSDVNVFAVLTEVTPRELADSEPVIRWWKELGQPAPLLMSEQEASSSADCFPIEFQDMKERRKVLRGRDVIAEIDVDRKYWRAQLEHELRAKLLRLRQHAAVTFTDRNRLVKLCADSLSTFIVLGRHAALYAGREANGSKRDNVQTIEALIGVPLEAFHALLDLREGKTAPQDIDPATLFRKYLQDIERLIGFVDGLEERTA